MGVPLRVGDLELAAVKLPRLANGRVYQSLLSTPKRSLLATASEEVGVASDQGKGGGLPVHLKPGTRVTRPRLLPCELPIGLDRAESFVELIRPVLQLGGFASASTISYSAGSPELEASVSESLPS